MNKGIGYLRNDIVFFNLLMVFVLVVFTAVLLFTPATGSMATTPPADSMSATPPAAGSMAATPPPATEVPPATPPAK